jgi:hypothetical protein
MPRTMRKTHDRSSDAGEVQSPKGRRKVARGASPKKKMLINGERSQYMYENKQKDDILTTAKGRNFA